MVGSAPWVSALGQLDDLGVLPASRQVSVGVALRHRDTGAEERAVLDVSLPNSPHHGRFWTPAAWQVAFGPSAADRQAATRWLTRDSMHVVWSSYDYVLIRGTAEAVDRTFAVTLRTYREADGSTLYAADRAPRIPTTVSTVIGLNQREVFRPASRQTTSAAPTQNVCANGMCLGTLSPEDLWSAYDLPSAVTGNGQRIGVFGTGSWTKTISDLRAFEHLHNLPQVDVRVVPIDNPGTDEANLGEWDIDTQASTGMAPGADELVLFFADALSGAGMTGEMSSWANDPNGPLQANASFGGCESLNVTLNTAMAEQPIFRQAAAEGRTLFVSTGDTGGSCTAVTGNGFLNTGAPQVEWPASSPYVVAVGGTQLYTDGQKSPKRAMEKAWEYTGGGTSSFMAAPDWQKQIPVIVGRCVVTSGTQPSGEVCRGLPDVAALSGDIATNGYAIVSSGQDSSGAGTSLSSPLWAGMWARIQAAAPLRDGQVVGLGFAPPLLYGQAHKSDTDQPDFFDVSVGSNGQYFAMPATPVNPTGWDYVSGLGVANVRRLMFHLARGEEPTSPAGASGSTVVVPGPISAPCAPDAWVSDPAGDVIGPFDGDVDTTGLRLSALPGGVRFSLLLPRLSQSEAVLAHSVYFTYDGEQYELDGQREPGLGESVYLYRTTGGSSTQLGQVGGGFDVPGHVVRLDLATKDFNALARPRQPMTRGAELTVGAAFTSANISTMDSLPASGCPFHAG
ncbi:MAG: pseudomonalisin [Actinomycetota bacterium]|nr:pseudomonalisin [Actinomycetota bacterium]